ncbi:hypothetical protein BSZ35_11535 [Salinibacter sp. 10B]|uniref:hypothetical protein n=1 Tax=Salinibacter sp. 10B TaxID=1923971 RepID=UPI000CF50323|nr:hypothetical protein [Salinibacter sp. 10B]PQJ35142.1 hypothetical protein BSZ35_11535 [Salinibacter sp. 10B]
MEKLEGSIWVLLNGYPTYSLKKGRFSYDHVDPSINTALTRKGNQYTLRIEPWTAQVGTSLEVGVVDVEGRVSANEKQVVPGSQIEASVVDSVYQAWSDRAREQWRTYQLRLEAGALDSIRAWASRNPLKVSTTFDTEAGPDFSRVFEEAPVIEGTPSDTSRLKDYAMQLRDLMARKDTSALFKEFRPAIEARYRTGARRTRSEFIEANRQAVVVEGAVLDFTRSDLRLQQWVDGRLWQVWREGAINRGLFQDASGGGLGAMYVAELDGEFKVVRY